MNVKIKIYAQMDDALIYKGLIDANARMVMNQVKIINDAMVTTFWKFFKTIPTIYPFLDVRQGICFRQLVHGRCTSHNRESKYVTYADCCCSMGAAWGPSCELCPARYSPQYQDLCLESGFLINGQGNVLQ